MPAGEAATSAITSKGQVTIPKILRQMQPLPASGFGLLRSPRPPVPPDFDPTRQLIESGQPLFLPKAVALELEWVLRVYDGFAAEQVLLVFDHLLAHPGVSAEDRPALGLAVAGLRSSSGHQLAELPESCLCRWRLPGRCQTREGAWEIDAQRKQMIDGRLTRNKG